MIRLTNSFESGWTRIDYWYQNINDNNNPDSISSIKMITIEGMLIFIKFYSIIMRLKLLTPAISTITQEA